MNRNSIRTYLLFIVLGVVGVVSVGNVVQARIYNPSSSFSNGVTIGSGSPVWTLGADANNSNAFVISPSSTLKPDYFTLSQTGTIGISSSTPYGLFSINGLAGGSMPLFVVASSTSGNATSTVMMIDSQGNTAFGSTTPMFPLSVTSNHAGNIGGVDLFVGDTTTPSPIIISHKGQTAQGSLTFLGFNVYNNYAGTTLLYNTASSGYYFQVDNRSNVSSPMIFSYMANNNISSTIWSSDPKQGTTFGIGTSTPIAVFQATATTSNATTSIQFGKPNQNKGTCITYYDAGGTPLYGFIATGATAFTYTSTKPSGCQN